MKLVQIREQIDQLVQLEMDHSRVYKKLQDSSYLDEYFKDELNQIVEQLVEAGFEMNENFSKLDIPRMEYAKNYLVVQRKMWQPA